MVEVCCVSEVKSCFLVNMSYEFCMLLNGFNGMIEVLVIMCLDDEQCECFNIIQVLLCSLLVLVEEVLDILVIEVGKLCVVVEDFVVVDVIQVIGLILLLQVKVKCLDYWVKVVDGVLLCVCGDVGYLWQILLNLVGNVVKFIDYGWVEICVSVVQVDISGVVWLCFDIFDIGIGVVLVMCVWLFDVFEQVDVSMVCCYEGIGLGIIIVKGLVEVMDGDIGYLENLFCGSYFWVELLFVLLQLQVLGVVLSLIGDDDVGLGGNVIVFVDLFLCYCVCVCSMQILVVDDYEVNCMVLQCLLQKVGYCVLCVDGGEVVLDVLVDSEFDVVIVDLYMLGMSGLDMLKELWVMQVGGGLCMLVLVFSVDVMFEVIQCCIQVGVYVFLVKFVVVVCLFDMLVEIVSNVQLKIMVVLVV